MVVFMTLVIRKSNTASSVQKVTVGSASDLVNQARDLEAKENILEAKAVYQRLINEFSNSAEIANWQKKIEDINIKLIFSPIITPKSKFYEVKPGDTLTKIAKEFKTTVELIKKSNNIPDDKIVPGKKIKVYISPFSILVDKSQNRLNLSMEEELVKAYMVSTGKNNSTPIGNFKIINKLLNPTWFKAGAVVAANSPENILGTRWLGFNTTGYGIHGTTEPQNLGKQNTQGCIRMSNSDVEELYTIVPVSTEVTIID
jgi:lipoprotein-anchoring transpeptidase ErfK/SrfK